jgi:hypothetical protein
MRFYSLSPAKQGERDGVRGLSIKRGKTKANARCIDIRF